ncbi:MAG: xanthine dehydrogenase family protein molybdopterin-binding subunit [Piscinibacter sp.]|uniref:xanthine dehydrogenase family protein molybdopterin-binding subunit n=1 Tax=Piscinibacter sp. TaxID=1903157 RepID=UPI002586522D|nr:xanthine dehydrogenase family protein molybdopterin-binding subunit [Piscinibacter sp.]MCW5664153.1 xanthine dehydrogenase family protein molybdopterin-binding subunit [Piscinibacter sp.]
MDLHDLIRAGHGSTATSRRRFLQTAPLAGLVLGIGLPGAGRAAEEPKKYGGDAMPHGLRDSPKLFVSITPDGTVTIVVARSEMGQGVRTSLPRIVADELEADYRRVRVAQAPGDEPTYGNQDTDGSRSTRHWFEPLRRCGAATRQMLEQAAAAQWKVPVAEVQARNHEVVHAPSGRRLGYGALAAAAARLEVPPREALKLKDPSAFRYIGKNDPALTDGPVIVDGRSQFGIDTRLPGMLYAVIARPPVLGGKLKGFDAAEALKVPGVVKVFALEGTPPPSEFMPVGGVVVVGKDTWAAIKGRNALKIDWDDGPHGSYDSEAFRTELEAAVKKPGGKVVRNEGDAYAALAGAAKRLEADYYVPHYAHATMECPAATARIVRGACEVWAPSQSPQAARDRVAKRLGLKPEQVKVNVTLLGGGFGRKSKADFVVEAALVSKEMGGQPVKLTWTREDDLHNDYFHTVTAQHLEAGLDASGKVVAWLHRAAEPTIVSIFAPDPKVLAEFELGLGLTGMPYQIPNIRIENPEAVAHTRIGWLRSVNNIQHAFAAQSFIAEIAAAQGKDHRDFLLALLGPDRKLDPVKLGEPWNHGESPERYPIDTGRLRKVIERVTQEAGWGRKLPAGQGLGLAAHYSFVSHLAAVVEVTVTPRGEVIVPRVDIAVDCGTTINPDRVRSQLEGACVMGLSQALVSEITFKNGRAQQDNFHQYEIMRMNAAPRRIVVHFVDSGSYDAPLGGVGEPGVPVIAPALMNAIHAATGKRIRRLPLRDQLSAPV